MNTSFLNFKDDSSKIPLLEVDFLDFTVSLLRWILRKVKKTVDTTTKVKKMSTLRLSQIDLLQKSGISKKGQLLCFLTRPDKLNFSNVLSSSATKLKTTQSFHPFAPMSKENYAP